MTEYIYPRWHLRRRVECHYCDAPFITNHLTKIYCNRKCHAGAYYRGPRQSVYTWIKARLRAFVFTAPMLQEKLGISQAAANKALSRLYKQGLLRRIDSGEYERAA